MKKNILDKLFIQKVFSTLNLLINTHNWIAACKYSNSSCLLQGKKIDFDEYISVLTVSVTI